MDLITAIKTRRSIRQFKDIDVDDDLLKKIIETAIWAPTACNIQGWKFIVVKDQALKEKIVEKGGSVVIKTAPVGILVLYNNQTTNLEYKDYIQSASATINTLLLTAHYYGLGGCWICHLPCIKTIRNLFKIPSIFSPIAFVALGYPTSQPQEVKRKYSVEDVISYNVFDFKVSTEKLSKIKLFGTRLLRKIYLKTPDFIKKGFLNKIVDKKFVKKFKN